MSTEPTTPVEQGTPPAEKTPQWPVLTSQERRILGVLVEKQKTTPDAYPLSINALVTGCNQKSNRDPVMNLIDVDVEEALLEAQKKGLVIRLTGAGRVERWRHNLYDAWSVSKAEMAVLCELLLRGPQTEGELRGRVNRMEPLEDLDALRALLRPLAERKLVVYLTPGGRRGTMLTHGFHTSEELDRARASAPVEPPAATTPPTPPTSAPARMPSPSANEVLVAQLEAALAAVRTIAEEAKAEAISAQNQVRELQTELTQIKEQMMTLAEQVKQIKDGLGI